MELHNFDELTELARHKAHSSNIAIVCADDSHIVETAILVRKRGIANPVLIGDMPKIVQLLEHFSENASDYRIEHAAKPMDASALAVQLVHEGEVNLIMKGMMESRDFLKPIVNRENGLGTGRVMSHIGLQSIPNYHKLVINTDAAMCAFPDLAQKKDILSNAIDVLHKLGYELPKAACLCCKETLDPKMIETTDARALQEMAEKGEFGQCAVIGPISYDIAISKEIAELKHFDSPVCGDVDILLEPNIHAGNILGKCLEVSCKQSMAGIVVGAQVPIVLTSRGAQIEEKINSIALAAAVS